MERNMGFSDRLIRLLIALLIGVLYYFKIIGGTLGSMLLALAGIFLATALISFCPLYRLFGIRTCEFKNPFRSRKLNHGHS